MFVSTYNKYIFERRSALKQPAVEGVGGHRGSNIKLIAVANKESSTPAEAQHYVPVTNRGLNLTINYNDFHLSSKSRWFPMSAR